MSNYINKLTNEEIESILVSVKLIPIELLDKDGCPLPKFERGENVIMVRCFNANNLNKEDEISKKIKDVMNVSKSLFSSPFSNMNNLEIVVFDDFMASRLVEDGEIAELDYKLNKSYNNFMNKKFKTYKADFEDYTLALFNE